MGHTSSSGRHGYERIPDDGVHISDHPGAENNGTNNEATNIDPLVAPTLRNLAQCPIYGLPEEVLVNIIQHLPTLEDESCLRASCRLFLRLYKTSVILPVHEPRRTFCQSSQSKLGFMGRRLSSEHRDLTRSTRLQKMQRDSDRCKGCLAAWNAEDWEQRRQAALEYYHCSGCGADHVSYLFSAAQRRNSAEFRVCIGHQGYMRLCDHKTASWAEIVAGANLLGSATPIKAGYRRDLAVCQHKSHDTGGRVPAKTKHDTRGRAVRLWLAAGYQRNMKRSGRQALVLGWKAYIPDIIPLKLPDDAGPDAKAQIDGTVLRRQLASLRENTGKYIFADPLFQKSPQKTLLETFCFDSGYCDCVHIAGSEMLPQHLKLAEPQHKTSWKEWEGGRYTCSTSPLFENFSHTMVHPITWGGNFFQKLNIYHPSELLGGLCVEYTSWINISLDDDPTSTLHLRRTGPLGRCSLEWMMSLDPESYDVESDHEGLNVYWCRQPGCANYFRSPIRLGDIEGHTRSCPRLCK